jgi:hypothetical protein
MEPEAALLFPSARSLGAGDGVQGCPDPEAVAAMLLDLLLDGEVKRVEPGQWP